MDDELALLIHSLRRQRGEQWLLARLKMIGEMENLVDAAEKVVKFYGICPMRELQEVLSRIRHSAPLKEEEEEL